MLILNKESTHEKNMPHYSSCNELRSYKNDTHQLKLVRVGKCFANKNKKACYWWQENGTIMLRLNVIASTKVSVFSMRFWNISQKRLQRLKRTQCKVYKLRSRQRSGIDTIKYQTWPGTPYGKVTKTKEPSHTRESRG